ncbi:MAG: sigma-70 family RNA polymerase sigma factor [Lentisphaeraceae bacterium]|nr:sigma-70 family RNA polymerase sigma factor [Lentisphaeraceae bacterium]
MDDNLTKAIRKVVDGDRDAYWYVVDQYKLMVRAYLGSILFNRSDIDDLTQEVFITAYRKIAEFDQEKEFSSWIRGIARFKLTNYMRTYKRKNKLQANFKEKVVDLIAPDLDAKFSEETDHSIKKLLECITKLPKNMRLVVKSGLNGVKAQSLADELDSTPGAIYNLQYRANGLLRECVKREVADE